MALFGWSVVSSALLGAILLFFICAICNKWLNDFGIPYNVWVGCPVGILLLFALTKWFSFKTGFGAGLIASLVAGILAGIFWFAGGDSGGNE